MAGNSKGHRRRFGAVRRLPSGRYQVRYRAPDGRYVTAPLTFATVADADRHLAKIETEQLRNEWTDPRLGRTLFSEWVEKWQVTTSNLRPKTRQLYSYLLRRHLQPAFGPQQLASIDVLAVRSWLARSEVEGVYPNTRAKAYRLLARILGAAVEARYIPRSPCIIKGAGVEHPAEMRFATIPQVRKLAEAVPERYRALILVVAFAGLRWGELAGLRRQRIDLDGRMVVAEQLTEIDNQHERGPVKSRAWVRTVALPRAAADALAAHLNAWAEPGPDGLVFTAPEGGPMRHTNFTHRVWYPATRAADVEGLRFHDLRHTAATLALAAGANTRELMQRIGHASPAAALRHQHVMDGRDTAVASALDDMIESADERSGTRMARRPRKRRRPAGE